MSTKVLPLVILSACLIVNSQTSLAEWNPPSKLSRDEIVNMSKAVLAMPAIKIRAGEELARIRVLEMDWDIGAMVYEPDDSSRIPAGPDGKKLGAFLIHGGGGDHRSMDSLARLMAGKFGFKVVVMTYPGYLYLLDPSRNWPGQPVSDDGNTLRTPIWNKDVPITRNQYDVVEDKSMQERYGTFNLACAKEGSEFYNRMAAYPVAFEETGKYWMQRHFPEGEYSIYIHGHSTGGPFSFIFSQRVANIVGVLGMENTAFGYIFSRQVGHAWNLPFSCLPVYPIWQSGRYVGYEAEMTEGLEALRHLSMLVERVVKGYRESKQARFHAEYPIHLNGVEILGAAAQATARRLKMNAQQTEDLVRRYKAYPRELSGPGAKPVPPVIFSISKISPDHTLEGYTKIVLPMFAAMNPAPKIRFVQFDAGYHSYTRSEPGLPMGLAPAVVKLWYDAIMGGYYRNAVNRRAAE